MYREDLVEKVRDGKFFGVTFIKRTDGEVRRMRARVGVDRTTGGGRPWTDEAHGVLTVWDVDKRAYRCIPCESVQEVRHHGVVEKLFRKEN